jgi:hypothetical protein
MLSVLKNLYKSVKVKYKVSQVLKRDNLYKNSLEKSKLIIFGPWLGEVGSELQYWIPFIRKIRKELFPNNSVVVISRGGVESWYQDITSEYIELFHYINKSEYLNLRKSVIRHAGLEKQLVMVSQEKKLISKIIKENNLEKYFLIHPSTMWREILPWVEGKTSFKNILSILSFQKIEVSAKYQDLVDKFNLPDQYFALKFYESSLFPKSRENMLFIKSLIKGLAEKAYLVMMDNDQIDNHCAFSFDFHQRLISIKNQLKPELNLGIQTEIIRRSIGFIGTNGGFSLLPAFVGRPSLNFYSACISKFMPTHFQHEMITRKIFDHFGVDPYTVISTNSWRYCLNLLNRNI